MKKWKTERTWTPSSTEKNFEKRLAENGFAVIGIREYQTKTDYKIEKDGIVQEYSLVHRAEGTGKGNYDCFVMFYNTRVEYERLKKAVEG